MAHAVPPERQKAKRTIGPVQGHRSGAPSAADRFADPGVHLFLLPGSFGLAMVNVMMMKDELQLSRTRDGAR